MDSIIGLYRRDVNYNDLRVGTPDPTQYHDISQVKLELNDMPLASRVGNNHGFSGLRGVIIPRATRDGGSRGHDHMIPKPAYIDPELTNRRLIVDPQRIQKDPDKMIDAIQQAYADYADPADATIAAYASFAEEVDAPPAPDVISIPQPQTVVPTPLSLDNPNAGHSPNTYVAPKASPGGGQIRAASPFGAMPHQPGFKPGVSRATPPPSTPPTQQKQASRTMQAIRSLRGAFGDEQQGAASTPGVAPHSFGGGRPLRKVTFELPGMGQFPCHYHDIIKHDGTLILVYDHSHPTQMVWFPPAPEDLNKEPTAIAIMVDGVGQEPSYLYLAYPTGVRFPYENKEFCLLTIEKEKPLG